MKWTPRDTAQQLQRLTRYTSIVIVSKYSLIALALVLVSMVFIVPALHEGDSGARLVFTAEETGEIFEPKMSNPRYQGVDKQGRPYNVNARSARQQGDGKILLDGIEADITLANGSWLAFNARTGIFDPEADTLFLPETVEVYHDAGYDMRTTVVHIDLSESQAYGDQRVQGQGPVGTITASGFRVDSEVGRIYFAPEVAMTLNLQQQKP